MGGNLKLHPNNLRSAIIIQEDVEFRKSLKFGFSEIIISSYVGLRNLRKPKMYHK